MSNKFFKDLKKSLDEVVAYKKGKLDLYSEYIEIPEPPAMTKNKHLGSDFDDYLQKQGILKEVTIETFKMIIIDQLAPKKKKQKNYKENLLNALKDPEKTLTYFNAILMGEDRDYFFIALQQVLKAG